MKDSPEILAQKLRRAVDQKKYAEQAAGHYMKQLRMAYPDLNQALDQGCFETLCEQGLERHIQLLHARQVRLVWRQKKWRQRQDSNFPPTIS